MCAVSHRAASERALPRSGNEMGGRWAVCGPTTPSCIHQHPGRVDDEVAAELMGIFGRAMKCAAASFFHDLAITDPYSPPVEGSCRGSVEPVGAIRVATFIYQEVQWTRRRGGERLHPLHVILDMLALAEGHNGDLDTSAKFISQIANRNHVLGTWQSMNMAVKDEHDVFAAMAVKSPDVAVAVKQDNVGGGNADKRVLR